MKIAILTYYSIANYGTLLQAYALWKFLEDRGHEIKFLDEPYGRSMFPYMKQKIRRLFSRHPIQVARSMLGNYFYNKMTDFNAAYPRTRRFESIDDLRKKFKGFDAVVVGSDLVWHPKWCSPDYVDIAFLDFLEEGCKKISISPSFSSKIWDAPLRERAGALLRSFDGIGVRELSGKNIATEISGRSDVNVFVDSALLLTADKYEGLLSKVKTTEPFVFNYVLGWSNGQEEQVLLDIVRETLGISNVLGQYGKCGDMWDAVARMCCFSRRITVGEWLRRIHDSSFVLTNSFHGTVFSILMHKRFATILIKGEMSGLNERAISLLKLLGLESRMLYNNEPQKLRSIIDNRVDWSAVDDILKKERMRVADFLKSFNL